MPYTGASDTSLPSDILKMPQNQRKAFVAAFNDALSSCMDSGGKDCEGHAMAIGRSAADGAAAKVGRRISAASRKLITSAIEALNKLIESPDDETAQQAAGDALQNLVDGETAAQLQAEPTKSLALLKQAQKQSDQLHQDQDARAKKFGIAPKDGGNLAPPDGYPVEDTAYADPVNYRYPMDAAHLDAALSYFNNSDNQAKGGYADGEWATMGKRIAESATAINKSPYEFKDGQVTEKPKPAPKAGKAPGDVSLEQEQQAVWTAWRALYPMSDVMGNDPPWLAETFDAYVIVEHRGNYYRVPYTVDANGLYTFADMMAWVAVERKQEWADKKAALFDITSPCGKKAIKVVSANARRIGAYATVWGELDCDSERMTRKAIEPYVGKGAVPLMLWMHGLDTDFGATLPGVWDGKSFKMDEVGLYIEGNIFQDAVGDKAWKRIESAGSFGLSAGSQWYLVKRQAGKDGTADIVDWPLLEVSIMEGGKQCVPSAQHKLAADVEAAYRKAAAKFGIQFSVKTRIGDKEMDDTELTALIEKRMAAAEAAKVAAAEAETKRKEEIAVKAAEIAAAKKAEWESELRTKWEEEQKKAGKGAKPTQPLAPATGAPGAGDAQPFAIKVFSPYDRLTTFDLCVRYELMRSYGKQPSTRFWRALAERGAKMAREEDTLRLVNGQPFKVPAIDWESLVPKGIDLNTMDGEVFGAKTGQSDRFVDSKGDVVTPLGIRQLAEIAIKSNELVYSTQANAGDEWVPTLMSAQLWRTIRLEAAVLALFEQFDMPSQPYDYPIESTDPVLYKVGEATDESQLVLTGGPFTDSKPGTGKITFSAGKLGAISYWSEEQEEDGIIAVEPQFQDQYGIKMAHGIDEVLISGDEATGTGNISYDGTSIPASNRHLIADGLRDQALNVTATDSRDGTTLTVDDFGATQALMGVAGKFGVNPKDLAFILDSATWHKAKLLPEVLTVDKFGPMATVLSGQLAALFGSPFVVSEDLGLTDTAGKISNATPTNNVKGSFLCVNKRGIKVGWKRRPRVRVVGLPGAEARYIVGSARFDIGFKEAGMVGYTYDLTV